MDPSPAIIALIMMRVRKVKMVVVVGVYWLQLPTAIITCEAMVEAGATIIDDTKGKANQQFSRENKSFYNSLVNLESF